MIAPAGHVLICTTNDPESLLITKIAGAMGLPLVHSKQGHGARLEDEPSLETRMKEKDPQATVVAIVEIPGPEVEEHLRRNGYEVVIIDHHVYDGLDRMRDTASLEQFLAYFQIIDEDLEKLGFDPVLVRGVASIDRGFLWQLTRDGFVPEDRQRIRAYYVVLKEEIGGTYQAAKEAAEAAWSKKEVRDGILVLRGEDGKARIREAASFLIADAYPDDEPTSIIIEADGRLSVQSTDKAEKLFSTYGGFLFGMKRCWGKKPKDGEVMPTVDEILACTKE